jgi:hypothetical protein
MPRSVIWKCAKAWRRRFCIPKDGEDRLAEFILACWGVFLVLCVWALIGLLKRIFQ